MTEQTGDEGVVVHTNPGLVPASSDEPDPDEGKVVEYTNPGLAQQAPEEGETVYDPDTGVQMTGGGAPEEEPSGTAGASTPPAEPTSSGEYASAEE